MAMVKCSGGCGRSIIAKDHPDGWTCFACVDGAKRRAARKADAPSRREFKKAMREVRAKQKAERSSTSDSDGYRPMNTSGYPSDAPNPTLPTTPPSDGYVEDESVLGYCARCGSPIPKFRGGRKVRADTKTCKPACRQWLLDERKREQAR